MFCIFNVFDSISIFLIAAKPPQIKMMEDIIIEEGESVKIKCRVKGYPKPLISWAKNGKVLKKRKGVLIRNTR
jgi:hypothetical protein